MIEFFSNRAYATFKCLTKKISVCFCRIFNNFVEISYIIILVYLVYKSFIHTWLQWGLVTIDILSWICATTTLFHMNNLTYLNCVYQTRKYHRFLEKNVYLSRNCVKGFIFYCFYCDRCSLLWHRWFVDLSCPEWNQSRRETQKVSKIYFRSLTSWLGPRLGRRRYNPNLWVQGKIKHIPIVLPLGPGASFSGIVLYEKVWPFLSFGLWRFLSST